MFKRPILAVAFVFLLGGAVLAAVFTETYAPLPAAPAAVASTVSAPESRDYATPVRPRATSDCQRVIVAPTFNTSGAVAVFEVILYHRSGSAGSNVFATVSLVQTVTAGSSLTSGGRFTSDDGYLVAPTLGCQIYDVRLRSISAGNVTWTSWRLGPNTSAATATANE